MNIYEIFGYLSIFYIVLRLSLIIWHFFRLFFLTKFGFRLRLSKLGQWAIITGSTDGIGKAYAKRLALRGLDIMLISRNADKLKNVKEEIESKYRRKVIILAINFTHPKDIYKTIRSAIAGLDVAVLVNNVGIAYNHPEYLLEIDDHLVDRLLNVNIIPVTEITRMVLPKMLEKEKGAIVNIASMSGLLPTPLLTVYSASKAYVDYFSRALNYEYRDKNIVVQSVMPSLVCTNLIKMKEPRLFVPTADDFAEQAVDTIGLCDTTAGYWPHELLYYYSYLMPSFWVTRELFNSLSKFRVSALRAKTKKHK